MKKAHGKWRRWASAALLTLTLLVVVASFLPLLESNAWWVRYMDYPRLQLAIALPILLILYLVVHQRVGRNGWALGLLTVGALGYHGSELYPYSSLVAHQAVEFDSCPSDSLVSVMIANVQEGNERSEEFLHMVGEIDPDVLLVMETDQWWDQQLSEIDEQFTGRVQHIPQNEGDFGMHLFSKLELVSPEFRFFFDAYTPTLFSGIRLRNGETFDFVGVHPRPPIPPSQSTAYRDGHLLKAALEARSSALPTIVAGDTNSVPWEDVTRRMMRIGELLDPRIGRGLYPTFGAKNPVISWPLDHILFQEDFGLESFEVLPEFGSDHYPVLARLCLSAATGEVQSASSLREGDLEQADQAIAAAMAKDTDEET
ncbi:endonuclease/exonuclease/phosphatase family protein [Devosia sp. RR2S18]|uniref:endonuclease/exonuclease/phosphatase family protein n=1 Tax=Devosia rhizosphaerae TaxID=3049774 RepID=UPI002541F1B2|nr:endonuclease/exonuclease/phosphatase family protein [Devosia sp. RR2S18]WIJ24964.1 endonuclease/exonuclease/phosphatase family protein [Devosia sp. RR2S18]